MPDDIEPRRLGARIDERIFHHLERIGFYARDTDGLIITRRDVKFLHDQAEEFEAEQRAGEEDRPGASPPRPPPCGLFLCAKFPTPGASYAARPR